MSLRRLCADSRIEVRRVASNEAIALVSYLTACKLYPGLSEWESYLENDGLIIHNGLVFEWMTDQ